MPRSLSYRPASSSRRAMLVFSHTQLVLLGILLGGGFFASSDPRAAAALLVAAPDPSDVASVSVSASGAMTSVQRDEALPPPDGDEEEEDGEKEEDDQEDEEEEGGSGEDTEVENAPADWPYYPHDFEFGENGTGTFHHSSSSDLLHAGMFILSDFVVAGTNLASYSVRHPPFLLYEDFDIGMMVRGDEMWKEMVAYRRRLERPSLSWYVDKVARKRWLGRQGFPQPDIYYLKYKDELVHGSSSSTREEEAAVILRNLPTKHGYAAKPTHLSLTMGSWLVDIDPNNGGLDDGDVRFTTKGKRLTSDEPFNLTACADSLAEGLQLPAKEFESWALKMVRPGLVIEELYSNHIDRSLPPHEFNMFVIWGRVYGGVWNEVADGRYFQGLFYRDGRPAPGCPYQAQLPDWVPWTQLVDVAESLSAHKDMFRVDMFVGVPRYSAPDAQPKIVVSESEIHPTTMFCNPYIADEMARLWVAGYKVGNYKTIPNDEVPSDFVGKANRSVVENAQG